VALTQSQAEIRANVRKFANVQGTTALLRHPDADLNDYINRALGSLHRRLTTAMPDQRILSSTLIATEADVSTYALPALFDHLISLELTVSGHKHWLQAYEMHERPMLASSDTQTTGIPFAYRLRGGNIEYLPTPGGAYSSLLWYVPSATQLTSSGAVYDTISRLDDFLIAYASRVIAVKDKNWDLVAACKDMLAELDSEIEVLARNRDRNSPPRVVDVYQADRWGRASRRRYR
jgi:hypothetical protein